MANRETLISEILSLDADTYAGIDDPSFLAEMSVAELQEYLAKMQAELDADDSLAAGDAQFAFEDEEPVDFANDAEADADAMRGIGWGDR